MREAVRNVYGYSPQPTSRRTRTELHQGQAIREEQRWERGAAFRTGGEQLYRRKRLGSVREMAPSVRHRGERRDQESRQVPLEDFKKLHRSALVAAKQPAGSEDYNDVQSAADRLLEMLPGENDQ